MRKSGCYNEHFYESPSSQPNRLEKCLRFTLDAELPASVLANGLPPRLFPNAILSTPGGSPQGADLA